MYRIEQQYSFVHSGTMQSASEKVSLFWIQLWIKYWWQSTCLTSLLQNLPSCSTCRENKTVTSVIASKTRCLQVLFIVSDTKSSKPEVSVTVSRPTVLFFFLFNCCFFYIDSFFLFFYFDPFHLSPFLSYLFLSFSYFHFFIYLFIFLSCTPRLYRLNSQPVVV